MMACSKQQHFVEFLLMCICLNQTKPTFACIMFADMAPRETRFKSKSYDLEGMADCKIHNTRAWTAEHPEPACILPPELRDTRGNISIINSMLTPEKVLAEIKAYMFCPGYVLWEAVAGTKESTDKADLERLWRALEREWGIRVMYMHLHRDEGMIDDKGEVRYDWHAHIGYTQFRADGTIAPVDKEAVKLAKDIYAQALNMSRDMDAILGPSLFYRSLSDAVSIIDGLKKEVAASKNQADQLVVENKRLREMLKVSGQTQQAEYDALKKLKESDMPLADKLAAMTNLAEEVIGHTAAAREHADAADNGGTNG